MPNKPPTANEADAKPAAIQTAPPDKLQTERDSYKHLYWRARWRNPNTGLAAACLRKHPLCADPFKTGCHQPSTVADHIEDHHGNESLFFCFTNLQGLCESCHNRKTGKSHSRDGRNITPSFSALDSNGRIQG